MSVVRHISFLKEVFLHSITAFGGPQGHYGMMLKRFANKRNDVTEKELMEFTAFCQLLPGASSTQTLTLIGYKKGGIPLGIVTLIIWVIPAGILMSLLSFLLFDIDKYSRHADIFRFIHPMAVGFLAYAAFRAGKISIKNRVTVIIVIIASLLTYIFFKNPIVFPLMIIAGGIITNFNKTRIPQTEVATQKIKWTNISLFVIIFLVVGFMSGLSRQKQIRLGRQEPQYRIWNLSENFYRFGSLVFGGGDVLVPLMYEQFVVKPKQRRIPEEPYMTSEQFLTGSGMVRAIPGPVFSVAGFHGGMAMRRWGGGWQLLGCAAGLFFIFLPSALLVLFFYPIWHNLKKYAIVYRSLEGINAVVVGIMGASSLYLLHDISIGNLKTESLLNIAVIIGTFLFIQFSRLPSPIIVCICLLLGWFF